MLDMLNARPVNSGVRPPRVIQILKFEDMLCNVRLVKELASSRDMRILHVNSVKVLVNFLTIGFRTHLARFATAVESSLSMHGHSVRCVKDGADYLMKS
jgi:hypothetical protein